jgi:DNA-binding response OmpR family regulator
MKKRILIADDDVAVRESLAHVLESENYDVTLAADGRETISKMMSALPDLVLLDVNMPHKNGWEAFELMERFHPLIPVIIITARPNQFTRAVGAGIDALMEKPLDLPLLLQTIRGLLAEPEQERVARLTDPKFTTFFLTRDNAMCSAAP